MGSHEECLWPRARLRVVQLTCIFTLTIILGSCRFQRGNRGPEQLNNWSSVTQLVYQSAFNQRSRITRRCGVFLSVSLSLIT